ncbi:hypothetical protein HN385_07045 [archaeon]|jgi:adenylyl- and sulfurtransferase ThiI|nr:hypothetical protein [archaeon]MBT3450985.1 hypothetical protein [archaeon]MBT6868595.1 hypothetical protein [archaeon]MBT7193127.1 hypothetical protein [archaeon]MBT7381107.1 hypothetical protein [archaeon]
MGSEELYDKILLRYGEIFLKGKNRNYFENILVRNVKKLTGVEKVVRLRSRYIIDSFSNHNMIKRVFGLVSYSLALQVDKDLDSMKKGVEKIILNDNVFNNLGDKKIKFKVSTKRSDKRFPIKSPDVNMKIGQFIESHFEHLEFSLKEFEIEINVEINQEAAYLFINKINCFGGLPSGVEGKVNLLCQDKSDLLAGLLMMRRGVSLDVLTLKDKLDISLLQKFSPKPIDLVKISNISEINLDMLNGKNSVFVVGQNFNELTPLEKLEENKQLIILRPLIAFSNEEIESRLKEFEDC